MQLIISSGKWRPFSILSRPQCVNWCVDLTLFIMQRECMIPPIMMTITDALLRQWARCYIHVHWMCGISHKICIPVCCALFCEQSICNSIHAMYLPILFRIVLKPPGNHMIFPISLQWTWRTWVKSAQLQTTTNITNANIKTSEHLWGCPQTYFVAISPKPRLPISLSMQLTSP